PFRRSLAAHAGAQLSPHDLIAHERIDAVVPGGALGLALAEELQALRPFGMGNPQPTLLVPAARVEGVAGMGEERQHARFTLVTGSSRSRGVAFGSTPRSLAAAGGEPHDLAVRLEPNRWNGAVEPRVVLRAVCATRPGELRVLGEADPFWTRVERELARGLDSAEVPPVGRPATAGSAGGKAAQLARDAAAADSTGGQAARLAGDAAGAAPRDRRGEGFAGVAGELLTSGEPVLVAVADVPRRRASLEALVGGLAPDGLAVSSWSSLLADPAIAQGFLHLIALDPPPGGRADPVLRRGGALAHLAWGLADVEFSLAVWRSQLALDAPLREAWRALSALPQEQPEAAELEAALRGSGRYGRSPESCAHLLRVLTELDLVEFTPSAGGGPRCRLRHARRTDLERSETYRACRSRLALIERDLAAELPAPRSVAAVAAPV
ncbi:MAG TPA: hypothetical protein VEQ61_01995, partial [Thermoleophilaceae bacterium]|nr:hypothetical protein [Thermoleophilaceae bacterium]